MTTDERIKNLEVRVLALENLLKLTAVDAWLERQIKKVKDIEGFIKAAVATNADTDDIRKMAQHTEDIKEILAFVKTWSDNVPPIVSLGLGD